MTIDLTAASDFMATHARLLDRRRYEHLFAGGDPEAAVAALEAYRNSDGGYGWGLEPDLRSTESQTGAALHAFEVFAEAGPTPRAVELCDWLDTVTLPDGGVPFAVPVRDPAGCAPFWAEADSTVSALQISAIVAEKAHLVAAHDPAVAGHPWLARISDYCLSEIRELDVRPFALVLAFAVRFLEAARKSYPEADALLDRLSAFVPADGLVPVAGGAEGETMRPLDFAPLPDDAARRLFSASVIDADLRRLAGLQQPDGGWVVDYSSYSPAAMLEWRGYVTVGALSTLRANGLC
ncbi:hypothetical protein [Fodinicola acaciae]|uniref:hypothetical protein n=1 Tax=Fodinicola acaciae TaxID=2681555 RepID=UPI0013D0D350|nr:hypothetical protein [Fodinicola acaciae]